MRTVASSDGVTIALHELAGAADARALILCHATGFCGRAYEPFATCLGERFHVLALDFRAHGDSSTPENRNFDWRALADDLIAVVSALGAEGIVDVVGVGHSLGGAVLMLAEAHRPGTVSEAYLFEPIILPDGGPGSAPNTLSAAASRRRASFASREEALYRYASRPPLDRLQAGSLVAYVEHGMREDGDGVTLKCTPESEAGSFAADGKPTVSMLAAVRIPVVVAVGSGTSPAAPGEEIVANLRDGRLERHPSLGHFGPLEAPSTVASSVLAALS